ncbi:MAG: radical SAM protein [Anaerolineae bacterium]|nr:radical SAM protein [Anaerolineae bacterium]
MAFEVLDLAPPEVDVEAIRGEWLALRPPYDISHRHLPLPAWARRPFTDSGPEAWQILCRDVPTIDPNRAFCIYLHIPFCRQRCRFCDCYSFRLAAHRERHVEGYLDLLAREVRLWNQLGTLAARPVSTIHLGGGTPTFLDIKALARLVELFRASFAVQPATEWALESTAAELAPEMLSGLDALGLTRLHVGVQTLDDPIRHALNRQTQGGVALDRIARAIERGWIVSVDLICGLPGQTLDSLTNDIRVLAAAGVNGFSIYELQLSSRNHRFAREHGLVHRDRQVNYFFVQAAAHLLRALGYRKTLFNHFADERDTNLYFTFPERGEDCLALGTIADGVFGDYHYRHPEYAAYTRTVSEGFPGLQGGLRRNEVENRLQPLITALMTGRVSPSMIDDLAGPSLRARWQELALLYPEPAGSHLCLTGNGSWFVGNMISELMAGGMEK